MPGKWNFLIVGDKRYELTQFHFHHPSEESVQGKRYDMVTARLLESRFFSRPATLMPPPLQPLNRKRREGESVMRKPSITTTSSGRNRAVGTY
ncbi:MAG: hypothetical protein WAK48_15365 [Candidatus Acidiferrum sp.]|jgi:hypothetical protein